MQHDNQSISPASTRLKTIGWLFFALLMTGAIVYQTLHTEADLSTTLNIFVTRFLSNFVEAMPFLLLGVLTSGLIEVLIRPEDILRWLPRHRLGLAIGGVCLGFLFPVGEYGVVLVTRRLFTKGLPMSMGVVFLLSAPVMNPIVFASTYIAFGWSAVFIGRFVIAVIVAITVGIVIGKYAQPEEVLKPQSMNTPSNTQPHVPFRNQVLGALALAKSEFFEMGRFLMIGCACAVTLQTFISQESLTIYGTGSVISVGFLELQAFILSVGSTSDSVLALPFVNTFMTGSIISFLSFGAMVDMKSMLMFTGVFRRKIIVYLIVLPFLMNLLAGVVINVLMRY